MEHYIDIKKDQYNYQISNYGNIRNIKTGKVRKLQINKQGYPHLTMRNLITGQDDWYNVHLLVLTLHGKDKPSETHVCDHIDGNRSNNHIDNLQWVTPSQNILKKVKSTEPKKKKMNDTEWREVIELFSTGQYSKHEVARILERNRTSIIDVLYGKTYKKLWATLPESILEQITIAHDKWEHEANKAKRK